MSDLSYTIFDSDTSITMLKWAITILVAGFVAQFGKKFATFLIEKIKRIKSRKSAGQPALPAAGEQPPSGPAQLQQGSAVTDTGQSELKLNKKMLKALVKERKKK